MSEGPKKSAATPEDDSFDGRILVIMGIVLFLAGAVCGAMLYAFGIAGRHFDAGVLRGGLLTFGIIGLVVGVGVMLMTALIRLLGKVWPQSLTIWSENRLLKRARRQTHKLLHRRHRLQEERARLTAKMQATYLLEKESARVANQKSLQELRGALQVSVVRSCEIVNEHLNRTLDQYQELVSEIEKSPLHATEKKELFDELNAMLNVDTMEQRRQSAQSLMENAIWEIRFSKARRLATKKPDAAVSYLKKIRERAESHRILMQIDALIREFTTVG